MKVNFSRFFDKLKKNGITQKEFKDASGLSSGVISKLLHNQNINTATICKICDYFQCLPEEIMEWIPDKEYTKSYEKKMEINNQIQA